MSFSQRVRGWFTNQPAAEANVPNLYHSKLYHVRYNPDSDMIMLLDRPKLFPIPLSFFDIVEECLHNGIHTPGCAHNRLGNSGLDNRTIMGHIGTDGMRKQAGDSIPDIACYLFAILAAAGCITRDRGHIEVIDDNYIDFNNDERPLPGSLDPDDINPEEYDELFLNAQNIHLSDRDLINTPAEILLERIINNAINAATSLGSLVWKLNNRGEWDRVKPIIVRTLTDLFLGLLNGTVPITYREWHTQTCDDLSTMAGGLRDKHGNPAWTFGNSQKVVNLIVKYLVVIARRLRALGVNNDIRRLGEIFLDIIDQVDIPVDSYIIEASWNHNSTHAVKLNLPYVNPPQRGVFKSYKVKPWSNWSKEDYLIYVKSLHRVFRTPLNWEGYAWTEVKRAH